MTVRYVAVQHRVGVPLGDVGEGHLGPRQGPQNPLRLPPRPLLHPGVFPDEVRHHRRIGLRLRLRLGFGKRLQTLSGPSDALAGGHAGLLQGDDAILPVASTVDLAPELPARQVQVDVENPLPCRMDAHGEAGHLGIALVIPLRPGLQIGDVSVCELPGHAFSSWRAEDTGGQGAVAREPRSIPGQP